MLHQPDGVPLGAVLVSHPYSLAGGHMDLPLIVALADCSMSRLIAGVMLGHLVQGGADVADGDPTEVAHPGLIEMPGK